MQYIMVLGFGVQIPPHPPQTNFAQRKTSEKVTRVGIKLFHVSTLSAQ